MSRRRRSRTPLAVSLFPFLAVLICTLGVLIVLLVLAVKAADTQAQQAQADADAVVQAEVDQAKLALDLQEIQLEGLQSVRPEAIARLNRSRATRSHYESETRLLRKEARRLAEELLQLEQQRAGVAAKQVSDAEVDSLKKKIELAEDQLAERREKAKETGPQVFSIVPMLGDGGTQRRPIFIECTGDTIVLQPLGIKLSKADFGSMAFPGNPLDAAVLAIRDYWQRLDLDNDAGDAYPLIVVRPNAATAFKVARQAMRGWDDQHGYQLVEADRLLEFGQPDPGLVEEVNLSIEAARARCQLLVQAARREEVKARLASRRRLPKSQRRPGLTVSRTGGGFVRNGAEGLVGGDSDDALAQAGYDSSDSGGVGANDFAQASYDPPGDDSPTELNHAHSSDGASDTSLTDANEWSSSGELGSESAGAMAESADANNAAAEGTAGSSPNAASASLAQDRGANWALPSRTAGAVPYFRPIRVLCYSDRLIIRGVRGDRVVPINDDVKTSVDPLVNEVWSQIESWGAAGANSYWKPQLRMTVMLGGHSTLRSLQQLLGDSGIVIEEAR